MTSFSGYAVCRRVEPTVEDAGYTLWYCHRGKGRAWMRAGRSPCVRLRFAEALELARTVHAGGVVEYRDSPAQRNKSHKTATARRSYKGGRGGNHARCDHTPSH